MPEFVPGLDLSESLYRDVVRPFLDDEFPGLPHAAARLGTGSDVLGYDTARSTDHGWGALVQVFLADPDFERAGEELADGIASILPERHRGHPVREVRVLTVRDLLRETLAIDDLDSIEPLDWLCFSQQALLSLTAGRVFEVGPGELSAVRTRLAWYPDDVWKYLLAAQWRRISQEEHFPGRCAEVDDEIGSRLLTARLVRDVMRLTFLQERRYAPYPKWLGTAFSRLDGAERLVPVLARALGAESWPEREEALVQAFELAAEAQNRLGIGVAMPSKASRFHDRPYLVIHGEAFSEAIRKTIRDRRVRAWPKHLGGADQISDSTDVLDSPEIRRRLRALYG